MWHSWERRGLHTGFSGKPKGKRPLRDLDINGKIILKWILEK
jgi:hypothetical protein